MRQVLDDCWSTGFHLKNVWKICDEKSNSSCWVRSNFFLITFAMENHIIQAFLEFLLWKAFLKLRNIWPVGNAPSNLYDWVQRFVCFWVLQKWTYSLLAILNFLELLTKWHVTEEFYEGNSDMRIRFQIFKRWVIGIWWFATQRLKTMKKKSLSFLVLVFLPSIILNVG